MHLDIKFQLKCFFRISWNISVKEIFSFRAMQKSVYDKAINACCIISYVSNIRCVSNQCIRINIWSIRWHSIHSKIMSEFVNYRNSENMLTHAPLLFLFLSHGFHSDTFLSFWIFFAFVLWVIRFGLFEFFFLIYE